MNKIFDLLNMIPTNDIGFLYGCNVFWENWKCIYFFSLIRKNKVWFRNVVRSGQTNEAKCARINMCLVQCSMETVCYTPSSSEILGFRSLKCKNKISRQLVNSSCFIWTFVKLFVRTQNMFHWMSLFSWLAFRRLYV